MRNSATAIAHHGELLQGVFRDEDGRLHRGLVTLPFAFKRSIALATRTTGTAVAIEPPSKTKALAAIKMLLEDKGLPAGGMSIKIQSNIPEGYGLGSSTADISAAIRALAMLFGMRIKARDIFRLAVMAEKASDGTMFSNRARLVCQREGITLEKYERELPEFSLLSINVAPDEPVSTLDYPAARYSDDEIAEFDELKKKLRRAVNNQDLIRLGRVATRSAVINQKHLPQPKFDELLKLAERREVVGLQVAHSGRMLGFMLPAGLRSSDRAVVNLEADLLELGFLPEFYPSLSH